MASPECPEGWREDDNYYNYQLDFGGDYGSPGALSFDSKTAEITGSMDIAGNYTLWILGHDKGGQAGKGIWAVPQVLDWVVINRLTFAVVDVSAGDGSTLIDNTRKIGNQCIDDSECGGNIGPCRTHCCRTAHAADWD